MEEFLHNHPFPLENGQALPAVRVGYHTYGNLNAAGNNVIWICHALTANSDVIRWWPGMVGETRFVNPEKYFIVCANILGSCYGSSGPLSEDAANDKTYYSSFPPVTIRDMVKAHILLRKHLGIKQIRLLMGGSMGGYQVLEWSLMEPQLIHELFLIATSAAESAWGIAVHTAQRLAIEADPTWMDRNEEAGAKGLRAARGIGILTYRNYAIMKVKQSDPEINKLDNYKASSYISYQGNKLSRRFNAYSYWLLTKSMDSHNIARNRGADLKKILTGISQRTLIVGITSDILCPVAEQEFLASNMPNSKLVIIDSLYGHDGFMVETEKIGVCLQEWMA